MGCVPLVLVSNIFMGSLTTHTPASDLGMFEAHIEHDI